MLDSPLTSLQIVVIFLFHFVAASVNGVDIPSRVAAVPTNVMQRWRKSDNTFFAVGGLNTMKNLFMTSGVERQRRVLGNCMAFVKPTLTTYNGQNNQSKHQNIITVSPSFRSGWHPKNIQRTPIMLFLNNDRNAETDQNNSKEGDLPAWVKTLIRWESSDSVAQTNAVNSDSWKKKISLDSFPFSIGVNNGKGKIWDEEMSPLVASLSGMVNVEALMAAASRTEEDMNLLLPNLKLLTEGNSVDNFTGILEEETNDAFTLGNNAIDLSYVTDVQVSEAKFNSLFPFLEGSLSWEKFAPSLKKNIEELTDALSDEEQIGINVTFDDVVEMIPENKTLSDKLTGKDAVNSSSSFNTIMATEKILRDATQRLEFLISSTSSAFSPSAIQDLIIRASNALAIQEASGNLTAAAYSVFEAAGKAPRATAKYTAELVQFANGVLAGGYVRDESKIDGDTKGGLNLGYAQAKPLFYNYRSARLVPLKERRQAIFKAADFATLSGAIYENTIPITHDLGHSIVAQGKTAGIAWMITDSIQYEQDFSSDSSTITTPRPVLVRTFVIRGYDASDEEVDREGLLNVICTAAPVPIRTNEKSSVQVHEGMLSMAEDLMKELEKFIDMTSPSHKFVFAGHSIGGSLSIILLLLLTNSRGGEYFIDSD